MAFIEELKNQTNVEITENGFVGYETTENKLLDFNFKVPSLRFADEDILQQEVRDLIESISDKILLFRYIFYLRDVRGGMGERRIFRAFIKNLAFMGINNFKLLFNLIVEYGRWDDLFVLMGTPYEREMTEYIIEALNKDKQAMLRGKPITLLAKWMPSENTSSLNTRQLAAYFRREMHLTPRYYRKLLSRMRDYSNIVEHSISKGEYDKIDYAGVPSKANLRYAALFLEKDEERRTEFLESLKHGEAKVNASTLYPSDVVNYFRAHAECDWKGRYRLTEQEQTLVDNMWKGLPDYGKIDNTLVVIDTSGSMMVSVGGKVAALDVSMGLGAYFAEHNKAPFNNKVVTFSERPQYCELHEGDLRYNVQTMLHTNWGMNTNVEAVFNLVLNTALESKCKQEEIPSILIISDMEFDHCGGSEYAHSFDVIKQRYERHGYELPKLIFWNVNSRTNTIPLKEGKNGVLLLSGFSPSSIRAVMSGELDPYKALLACVNVPRYDKVEEVVRNF